MSIYYNIKLYRVISSYFFTITFSFSAIPTWQINIKKFSLKNKDNVTLNPRVYHQVHTDSKDVNYLQTLGHNYVCLMSKKKLLIRQQPFSYRGGGGAGIFLKQIF